ncbi:uncharacterized protein EV420DRAFT_1678833 [Desarmillaria tabescens]|uniref:F-box domain-containing protein n=1 Tax=Armillaria tabescens TaxID=1929756 RepID=A0AA39KCS2_ARMTA|nr:uncharacterized protein EV420DRAFT_1678833 [Desarmillaria tabescens]KAK0458774.1 hypothetical protein EV420DRAFT_1678833 [Desarmillaria tabescens]
MAVPYTCTTCDEDSTPPPLTQYLNISKSLVNFPGNDMALSSSAASFLQSVLNAEAELIPSQKKNYGISSLKLQIKGALSPIGRLPTEIFIEIFRCDFTIDAFDSSKVPWTLAQVCSTWREIITVHCPDLWSSITVNSYAYRRKDPVSLLKTVLNRSGQSDLHIDFWEIGIEKKIAKQMLDLLFNVSNRWSNIAFDLQPSSLSSLSVVRGRVDRLSKLSLSYHGHGQPPSCIDAFEITPLLSDVNISVGRDDDVVTIVPCGSESLQLYHYDRAYGDVDLHRALLDTILKSPNLSTLQASYRNRTTVTRPFSTRINSTSIRFLQAFERDLLDSLSLPALDTVWLGPDKLCHTLCPEDTLPSLLRLITASHCSLTRLVLAEIDISHGLIAILRHAPMLDSLELYFAWWSNSLDRAMQLFVTAMMESNAAPATSPGTPFRPAILPCLTCFKIEIRDVSRFGMVLFINDMFVRMLSIRRTMTADKDNKLLQTVTVSLFRGSVLRMALDSDFQALRDGGLNLTVSLSESSPGMTPTPY